MGLSRVNDLLLESFKSDCFSYVNTHIDISYTKHNFTVNENCSV